MLIIHYVPIRLYIRYDGDWWVIQRFSWTFADEDRRCVNDLVLSPDPDCAGSTAAAMSFASSNVSYHAMGVSTLTCIPNASHRVVESCDSFEGQIEGWILQHTFSRSELSALEPALSLADTVSAMS